LPKKEHWDLKDRHDLRGIDRGHGNLTKDGKQKRKKAQKETREKEKRLNLAKKKKK